MKTARQLQIVFYSILLSLAFLPQLNSQVRITGIIDPAGFTRFLPNDIGGMPRTSHAVTAIEENRSGSFASSCTTYYGSGSVLLAIDHQPDRNSLKRVLIQNYLMIGTLSNASVTRTISQLEGGVLITSEYHKANYVEHIVRLNNDVLVRIVWKGHANAGSSIELTQMIDLKQLGSLSPEGTAEPLARTTFSGE